MDTDLTTGMFLRMLWEQSVKMNPKLAQVTENDWKHAFLNCCNRESEEQLLVKYQKWKTGGVTKSVFYWPIKDRSLISS